MYRFITFLVPEYELGVLHATILTTFYLHHLDDTCMESHILENTKYVFLVIVTLFGYCD